MKLRFYLNKKLDQIIVNSFLEERGGGLDFSASILRIHPDLNKIKTNQVHKKERIVNDYVDDYYRQNRAQIKQKTDLIRNAWQLLEDEYILRTEQFFQEFSFPPGRYIAYPSIVKCQPRFLEDKTFQFFYDQEPAEAIQVIAHELLHFIFFDFIEQKMISEIKPLSDDQRWDLSEIFNVLALQSEIYQPLIDPRTITPYPDHLNHIKQLRKDYWRNATELTKEIISLINKS